ncbi:unnamed protein product [Amoebophrya sp. A120]|nr:unnamed protein product [Amoebophrya sp. A120]|eukprot:GSA120T00016725001.1
MADDLGFGDLSSDDDVAQAPPPAPKPAAPALSTPATSSSSSSAPLLNGQHNAASSSSSAPVTQPAFAPAQRSGPATFIMGPPKLQPSKPNTGGRPNGGGFNLLKHNSQNQQRRGATRGQQVGTATGDTSANGGTAKAGGVPGGRNFAYGGTDISDHRAARQEFQATTAAAKVNDILFGANSKLEQIEAEHQKNRDKKVGKIVNNVAPPGQDQDVKMSATTSTAKEDNNNDSDSESSSGDYGPRPEQEEEKQRTTHLFNTSWEITNRHKKSCMAFSFDKSGANMVTADMDGHIYWFDFNGTDREFEPYRNATPKEDCPCHCSDIQHIGDGMLLVAVGDAKLRVYGREMEERGSAFTLDRIEVGAPLFTTNKGDYALLDPANTKGHTTLITDCAWHPDDPERFLSSSIDGTIRIWNVTGRKIGLDQELGHETLFKVLNYRNCFVGGPQGVYPKSFAVDPVACKKLLAGCNDGSLQLFFLDKKDRKPLIAREAHKDAIVNVVFFDGKILSRSRDGTMKLWNASHVVGPNLKPIHVWDNLPSDDQADRGNMQIITDFRNPEDYERTKQMVATCTSGMQNTVQVFSLHPPYERLQILYFEEAVVRIAYPMVKNNANKEIDLEQLAERRAKKDKLLPFSFGVGGKKDPAGAGAASSSSSGANKATKDEDHMGQDDEDFSDDVEEDDGGQPKNKDEDPEEDEAEKMLEMMSEQFGRFELPDYEQVERQRKAAQEAKKLKRKLRKKKEQAVKDHLAQLAANAEAGEIDQSFLQDILQKSKKGPPEPLRQLFVGLKSGKIVIYYNTDFSKRGILFSLRKTLTRQKKDESSFATDAIAADDKQGFWDRGIRLMRDGNIKEMGFKGKQRVKTELERRARIEDTSMPQPVMNPYPVHDGFAQALEYAQGAERSKLNPVTKMILAAEGITLDEKGHAVQPEGVVPLHEQNPQQVLQQFQPKSEEDLVYTRAYRNNRTVLDYDIDEVDTRDKATDILQGEHCPQCGRKICSCGYMRRLKGLEEDPEEVERAAKKARKEAIQRREIATKQKFGGKAPPKTNLSKKYTSYTIGEHYHR